MLWAAVDSTFSAWRGPSLLVVSRRGESGAGAPFTGYFFRETRYLRTLRFTVNGRPPWWCGGAALSQRRLSLAYVYPELPQQGGNGAGGSGAARDEIERDDRGLPRRALEIGLELETRVAGLLVSLTVANRAREPVSVDLAFSLDTDFVDLQDAERGGTPAAPAILNGGRIELRRPDDPAFATGIDVYGPLPWQACPGGLAIRFAAGPGEESRVRLEVIPRHPAGVPDPADLDARDRAARQWRRRLARVASPPTGGFGELVNRSMDDLGSLSLLEGAPDEWLTPAAGIPMYPALFGRDALTAGWQAASLDRGEMLDATLTRLGRLQGRVLDPARDEQPGRIVQQARAGPRARQPRNPFDRYYGDVASPLMFVVALAQLYAWNGDRATLARHWDAARRVLDWARVYGDADGDGYIEYHTTAPDGPIHQGWKDSGDAMLDPDGRPVKTPLAAAEVQGYWFAAQQLAAVLALALGARHDAMDYWRSAMDLKRRFNRDFWMPEHDFPALALDPRKRQVRSIGSNAGHCLAAGIIARDRIPAVVGRLFAPDLFSGWGIRTLSADHPAYDPVSYHRGSVWAVENATIAFGLRRYGLDARALDLIGALADLAPLYPGGRIPECVGGHSRWEHPHPGAYPRATSPQAWNQSAFPLLLQTVLGLQPLAPLGVLIVDPVLPSWLPRVTLDRLRVGGASVGLQFTRGRSGRTRVRVLRKLGRLRVLRQPPPESLTARAADRWRGVLATLARV